MGHSSRIQLVSFPRPASCERPTRPEGLVREQASLDAIDDFDACEDRSRREHRHGYDCEAPVPRDACERARCILPRGRSLDDTVRFGREALAEHINGDLFGEGSDFPAACDDSLRRDLLDAARCWTPEENTAAFETFDPKEQGYETELCGRPFTLTFTQGWKTARAMMNDCAR